MVTNPNSGSLEYLAAVIRWSRLGGTRAIRLKNQITKHFAYNVYTWE